MARESWWRQVLGDRDRLGWWTLPVFVMVGLAGAVLAGTLVSVYYAQQVNGLRDETREGRQELRDAVERVRQAGDEAQSTIQEEVSAVQEALGRNLPIEDAPSAGVVAIRARPTPPPATTGTPQGGGSPAPNQQQNAPAPPPRVGSGFAVAADGAATFFATTYSLVADANAPGGVLAEVEVISPGGTVVGAVHSWDEQRDLALVRAGVGEVTITKWRPSGEALALGERVVAVGVTPSLNTLSLAGNVGFSDVQALVTDLAPLDLLQGAPIVDGQGRVVAVNSHGYRPFGAEAGERQASAPVQLLCERMLRNCQALEATAEDG